MQGRRVCAEAGEVSWSEDKGSSIGTSSVGDTVIGVTGERRAESGEGGLQWRGAREETRSSVPVCSRPEASTTPTALFRL